MSRARTIMQVMPPIALEYGSPDAARSRVGRVAVATAAWSVIGGLAAAVALIVLHPHPTEALPAGPVVLICLMRGGGDWGAVLFIWAGGFVLYGIYGFLITLPSRTRHRIVIGVICLVVHLGAAALCEMKRLGQL